MNTLTTEQRLLRLADTLRSLPDERFNMYHWTAFWSGDPDDDGDDGDNVISLWGLTVPPQNACGTTCCLAGWLVMEEELAQHPGVKFDDAMFGIAKGMEYRDWSIRGAELLGLHSNGEFPLFFEEQWPAHYRGIASDTRDREAAIQLLTDMAAHSVVRSDWDSDFWENWS